MKISKRKDGYFLARIPKQYLRPGESRPRVMGKTKREVQEKLDEEIDKRKKGIDTTGAETTLKAFMEWFLDFYKTEGDVVPRTLTDYRYQADKNILPYLGTVKIGDLGVSHVDDWKKKLRTERVLGDRTIEYAESVLRRALQYAVERNYIERNPASAKVRVAKRKKGGKKARRKVKFFTPEEIVTLFTAAKGHRDEALVRLMIETGMRPGEIFGLRWEDVNLDEARLRVTQALEFTGKRKGEEGPRYVFGPPKTELSARVIEFSHELSDALREHRSKQSELRLRAGRKWEEHDLVFTTTTGTHHDPANALKSFQRLCVSAGLGKRTLYATRHTTGSLLLPNGATIKDVQELLGHSTAKLTLDTYSHALPGSGRKVSNLMTGIIRRETQKGKAKVSEVISIEEGKKVS